MRARNCGTCRIRGRGIRSRTSRGAGCTSARRNQIARPPRVPCNPDPCTPRARKSTIEIVDPARQKTGGFRRLAATLRGLKVPSQRVGDVRGHQEKAPRRGSRPVAQTSWWCSPSGRAARTSLSASNRSLSRSGATLRRRDVRGAARRPRADPLRAANKIVQDRLPPGRGIGAGSGGRVGAKVEIASDCHETGRRHA